LPLVLGQAVRLPEIAFGDDKVARIQRHLVLGETPQPLVAWTQMFQPELPPEGRAVNVSVTVVEVEVYGDG
jgi:hypothetical protein